LRLRPLGPDDAPFILELVNEPAWLRHIGDKHVASVQDAERYIRESVLRMYERFGYGLYLVESKDAGEPLGICGFVKRDSLDCPDLGFAFLERFWNRGYASEAARAAL
jgi:ribosomal-protein-alanine N-acetyltransferase